MLPLENCGESSIFAWHSWHSRTRPPLFASGRDEPRRHCVGGGGDQLWIVVKVDLTLRLQPQLFPRRRDLISLAAPIASNGNKSARDCTANPLRSAGEYAQVEAQRVQNTMRGPNDRARSGGLRKSACRVSLVSSWHFYSHHLRSRFRRSRAVQGRRCGPDCPICADFGRQPRLFSRGDDVFRGAMCAPIALQNASPLCLLRQGGCYNF